MRISDNLWRRLDDDFPKIIPLVGAGMFFGLKVSNCNQLLYLKTSIRRDVDGIYAPGKKAYLLKNYDRKNMLFCESSLKFRAPACLSITCNLILYHCTYHHEIYYRCGNYNTNEQNSILNLRTALLTYERKLKTVALLILSKGM